ncbi:MAG: ribonuclease P [Nanoarchaeota archaeon]|nr:ribonuclease P [Nanoarchaeota archaeon]
MRHDKSPIKDIARGEIDNLFLEAEKRKNTRKDLSDSYVLLANKIATRCKVKIPSTLKYRFCKNCKAYFVFGKNVRIRMCEGKLVVSCLECKHIRRMPVHGDNMNVSL